MAPASLLYRNESYLREHANGGEDVARACDVHAWSRSVQIRSDKLKELLSKHGGFGAVVAFKPTGWTFKGGSSTAAPAASSAPHPASNHHAKATDGASTVPLLVTHPSPAPLQDFLNQPRVGADRNRDSFSKHQTDAHGLCEVDAAQDISTACAHARDGHMGELCDVSAGAFTHQVAPRAASAAAAPNIVQHAHVCWI